jgi:hypothetical protein
MPKFEFRFDLAALLLASVLTAVGISSAEAGRKGGSNTGEFRGGTSSVAGNHVTGGAMGGVIQRGASQQK